MRFAKLCLLLVALSGCGGGSQVSPVVEYNAALQAIDDRLKILDETNRVIKSGSLKEPQLSEWKKDAAELEKTIEKLKVAARNARARI